MYSAWDYLAAIIYRLHGKEINITQSDLDAVKNHVVSSEYHHGKITLRLGIPEAWPESEQRIDVIGSNGNNGEHYGDIEVNGS